MARTVLGSDDMRRASSRWVRACPPGEGREEDELVGGDAVRRERRVRPAVERQVRGAEGDRDVASGGHRRLRQIRAYTHDQKAYFDVRIECKSWSAEQRVTPTAATFLHNSAPPTRRPNGGRL